LRSAYPPERLEIELQSRLGPFLSERGYRVVGHGVTGVTWRREMSGKATAGLVALGLLALGGVLSGDAGSVVFGIFCAVGAAVLIYVRHPATVTIDLARIPGGTELTISGGSDVPRVRPMAETVAGPPPAPEPRGGPEAPGSLWSPPRS
jgi:hypothetical protein